MAWVKERGEKLGRARLGMGKQGRGGCGRTFGVFGEQRRDWQGRGVRDARVKGVDLWDEFVKILIRECFLSQI